MRLPSPSGTRPTQQMRFPHAIPSLALLAAATLSAQTLPPTAPTTSITIPAPITATPAITHGRHAYVTWQDGLLNVRADNSSLNVILRDISRQTGMTITGGVADQRVFGNYGPADAGTVLATLLDGTGVNILIQETQDHQPAELILTPRTGGPTPPNPSSAEYDEEARAEALPAPTPPGAPPSAGQRFSGNPVNISSGQGGVSVTTTSTAASAAQPSNVTPVPDPNAAPVPPPLNGSPVTTPPSSPQPWNNVNGSPANTSPTASTLPTTDSVPIDTIPTPPTTPSANGIVDAPNPPPAGTTANPATSVTTTVTTAPDGTTTTTTVASPNGVKTPEQVYQQLLELQKAKAAQQPGTPSSTTTTPAPSTTPQ